MGRVAERVAAGRSLERAIGFALVRVVAGFDPELPTVDEIERASNVPPSDPPLRLRAFLGLAVRPLLPLEPAEPLESPPPVE
ncbi:MAG: hypothetical protein ACKVIN_08385 [Longimicrobiales bacterium]